MANIRYLNQQTPFWDFISSFDSTTANHPFSDAYNPESRTAPPEYGPPPHDGPPPPHHEAPPPPPDSHDPSHHGPPPGFPFGNRRGGPHHHGGPHGHHGGPRGGWGSRGGGRCGPGARGFGGWPTMGGGAANIDMSKIAEFISQFMPEDATASGNNKDASKDNNSKDFTPPADIFDTESAYIIHLSLPGARKEDVGVNWDADKSELNVAGVIYRPGDEEFLKTLALDERKVGVFERKVRIGSKTDPAQVDADAVSAKMEDGILMVTIPKVDGDIVEIRKVDIE